MCGEDWHEAGEMEEDVGMKKELLDNFLPICLSSLEKDENSEDYDIDARIERQRVLLMGKGRSRQEVDALFPAIFVLYDQLQ